MKLLTYSMHGLAWPFADTEIHLDFAALDEGVVAFTGPIGAGKTTVMEGTGPLTLYRRSPYYSESFCDHVAPGVRDAYSDLVFEMGGITYRVRVQADAVKGKTEAYFWCGDVTGNPVAGPLLTAVDERLRAILPPLNLFLAGPFAAQKNQQSFFELSKAERKALFADLLGLGELQQHAERAKQRHTEALFAHERARLASEGAANAAAERDRLDMEVANLTLVHEAAQAQLADARTAEADARVARDQAFEAVSAQDAAATAQRAEREERAERRMRLDADRRRLMQRHAASTAQLHALGDGAAIAAAAQQVAALDPELVTATEAATAARRAATAAHLTLTEKQGQLANLRTEAAGAKGTLAQYARQVIALATVDLSLDLCQRCALTQEGQRSKEAQELLQTQYDKIVVRGAELRTAVEELTIEVSQLDTTAVAAEAKVEGVTKALRAARVVASQGGDAVALKATLAELEEHVLGLDAELARLPADGAPLVVDRTAFNEATRVLNQATYDCTLADRAERECQVQISQLDGKLAEVQTSAAALPTRQAEVAAAAEAVAEWTLLERALGRDGIQALEIDAAGPSVQAIANDLLTECYSSRFQVKIVTTQERKGGGTREVFDIRVLDSLADREAVKLSGGEMALVDEGVRLALAIFNSHKSGVKLATLWRDESSGPLDPVNADAYMRMLRRARTLGGFHHVLLISHQQSIVEQADVRFVLANGQVTRA